MSRIVLLVASRRVAAVLTALVVMTSAFFVAGCAGFGGGAASGDYLSEAGAVKWPTDASPLNGRPKAAITYWIEPTTSNIPGVDMPRAAERGLREWQGPLEGLVTLTKIQDRETADIVVRFGTRDEMGGRQDIANLSYADAHHTLLKRVEVIIDRRLPPWDMTAAARHGMGHALGWRGHPKDSSSVMFHEPRFWVRISGKDARTMQAIYRQAN